MLEEPQHVQVEYRPGIYTLQFADGSTVQLDEQGLIELKQQLSEIPTPSPKED